MKKWNYYNDSDPKICAWVRELISAGLVPDGEVDGRSIADVQPGDVRDYIQCHFFCGILGWPLAFRLAGWPDDRPGWSGSAPCQPFSLGNVAHGGGKGKEDHRHLAPVFCQLVKQCRPPTVFGEQVASAIGKGWLDDLFADLEASDYACGAAVLPACGYGAQHERKRLFWVADAGGEGRKGHQPEQRILEPAAPAFAIDGDTFAHAGRVLAGDFSGLLRCDGLSVQMERDALRGYGNAIVPQVAAEFIAAYMAESPCPSGQP